MATGATNTFSTYDGKEPDESDYSTTNRRFTTNNTHSTPPRPGQHLDG